MLIILQGSEQTKSSRRSERAARGGDGGAHPGRRHHLPDQRRGSSLRRCRASDVTPGLLSYFPIIDAQ
jgi:hypothetical protein